jgi:hypothetical protein
MKEGETNFKYWCRKDSLASEVSDDSEEEIDR